MGHAVQHCYGSKHCDRVILYIDIILTASQTYIPSVTSPSLKQAKAGNIHSVHMKVHHVT